VSILLRYRPPYDWPSILAFLRLRAIAGIETASAESYARTIEIGGVHGIVAVRPADGNALRAMIRFSRLSALPTIIARLRRVFDLAADPQTIGAHLAEDPTLAPLVAARPGLRVPGAWNGFELAIRALLGQQITVVAAGGLAGKLVAGFGEKLMADNTGHPGLTHVFPAPERVAGADLAVLGMPRARAAALSALAATVAADPLIFGARRSLGEAIEQLRALSGIGEWTAQYIAMRELREPDAFPASDIGLMRAMADGDGRYLLNLVEQLAALPPDAAPLDPAGLAALLARRAALYDRDREEHYNLISALHKSLRGSDPDAALYWFARMLEGGEDPRYVARRLVRFAVEDVGLADPAALGQALSAWDAYERLGSPEGELAIAQAVLYLGTAPKSNAAYVALGEARKAARATGSLSPPAHILNAPTRLMRDLGYGRGYAYDHEAADAFSGQDYFPEGMERRGFYRPRERGFERELARRLEHWARLRVERGGA